MSETKYGDEATAEIVWRIIKPRIEDMIREMTKQAFSGPPGVISMQTCGVCGGLHGGLPCPNLTPMGGVFHAATADSPD